MKKKKPVLLNLAHKNMSADEGRTYIIGKFVEHFFGVRPLKRFYLAIGLVLWVATISTSIALGFVLVATTESQLVIETFGSQDTQTSCDVMWLSHAEYEDSLASFDTIKGCSDNGYWESVANQSDRIFGRGTMYFGERNGLCGGASVDLIDLEFDELFVRLDLNYIRTDSQVFLYSSEDCNPENFEGTFDATGCSFVQLATDLESAGDDGDLSAGLEALRMSCATPVPTDDEYDKFVDFVHESAGAYICTATVSPRSVLEKCDVSGNIVDGIFPASHSSSGFSFTDRHELFPALVSAIRRSVYQSPLYQTLLSLAYQLEACFVTALVSAHVGTYEGDFPGDFGASVCQNTLYNFCDRFCHMSYALRPDLIDEALAYRMDLLGDSLADCQLQCSRAEQFEVADLLYRRLNLNDDMDSLIQWIVQRIVRCVSAPLLDTGVAIQRDAFAELEISCLVQGQVDKSDQDLAMERFVTILSFIGTFQIILSTVAVLVAVVRGLRQHRLSNSQS
jgi:hypothetical protein